MYYFQIGVMKTRWRTWRRNCF